MLLDCCCLNVPVPSGAVGFFLKKTRSTLAKKQKKSIQTLFISTPHTHTPSPLAADVVLSSLLLLCHVHRRVHRCVHRRVHRCVHRRVHCRVHCRVRAAAEKACLDISQRR